VPGDDESHPTLACRFCGNYFPRPVGRSGRQPQLCSPACKDARKTEVDRERRRRLRAEAGLPEPVPKPPRIPKPPKPEPVPKPPPRGHAANSEIQYDDDEVQFLRAVDAYKREKRRPFPTLAEYLAILKSLGYRKGERSLTCRASTTG
jgi:hypothetical protein